MPVGQSSGRVVRNHTPMEPLPQPLLRLEQTRVIEGVGRLTAYNSHIKQPDKPIWEVLGVGIWLGVDLRWRIKFYLIEFLTNQRYFK